MFDEKCIIDPNRDCLGKNRADEVAGDVKDLDRRLTEFQKNVTETNGRFGARIGKLEARDEVREEQYKNLREKLNDISRDVSENQLEQKNSIAELRKEHKESMEELRKGNKEILDVVTPLKHKVEATDRLAEKVEAIEDRISPMTYKIGEVDKISGTVNQMQARPGEKWESMKDKFTASLIGAFGSFAFGIIIWLIIQVGGK